MNWETGPESDQLRPLDHSLAVVNWNNLAGAFKKVLDLRRCDSHKPLDHSLAVVSDLRVHSSSMALG